MPPVFLTEAIIVSFCLSNLKDCANKFAPEYVLSEPLATVIEVSLSICATFAQKRETPASSSTTMSPARKSVKNVVEDPTTFELNLSKLKVPFACDKSSLDCPNLLKKVK